MVNPHPAKFGGHRRCDSADMNILTNTVITPQVGDIRDCMYPLTPAIIIFSKVNATHVSNNNLRNNFYENFF